MSGRSGEFKQERMLRGVAMILILQTADELAEMDFVQYVDLATFLHLQDNCRGIR